VKRRSGGLYNYMAPVPGSSHDPFFDPDADEARPVQTKPVNYMDRGWGRKRAGLRRS